MAFLRRITVVAALCACAAWGDSGMERTYYDAARMKALESNLALYEWARTERDATIARADAWLKYDDARLRTLVPPPEVPRAFLVHEKGAPVHGDELLRRGDYSWIISFDEPWKVRHPADNAVYPSNDFAAYLKGGMKDRALLTGPYPDDGWGWKPTGAKHAFWFVAYYANWSFIKFTLPALDDLSRAYLFTGDARYAHACAVILWQLADYYPRYDHVKQSRYGTEFNPNYQGRVLNGIWEALYTAQTVPAAYDAIKPALADDRALAEMIGQDPDAIRRRIEENLLLVMSDDIMTGSGRIAGNYGMHQAALLRIAAALRHHPRSRAMTEWIRRNPEAKSYADLGIEDALNNLIHRDGYPFESPAYNIHWVQEISRMTEALGEEGRSITALPRFRGLFTWPLRMTVLGRLSPALGDASNMFHSLVGWTPEVLESGFRLTGDPVLARAMVQAGVAPRKDLFTASVAPAMAEAAPRHPQEIGVTSELMPGVGFGTLQTRDPEHRAALALFYGEFKGHSHADRLHLDLYAFNTALTPDFGYPERTDGFDPHRFGFIAHTVSHNTVMVDARRQQPARGRLHVYDPGEWVQVIEASAENVYPGTVRLYRRTLILVEVRPGQAYVVDIFRVRGGGRHNWLVHGTQADFSSDLPFGPERTEGTLAGPDVPFGEFYDDAQLRGGNPESRSYGGYTGSGFQYLFNVRQTPLAAPGTATWRLTRTPELVKAGAALRAHLVPCGDETVFACAGRPQRRTNMPETVKFLVRERSGADLESVFVTVFEPYQGEPFIRSVSGQPTGTGSAMPVSLTIDLGDTRHVITSRLAAGDVANREIATVRESSGSRITRSYALTAQTPRAAVIKTVNYATGEVVLEDAAPEIMDSQSVLRTAIVESAHHAAAVQIKEMRGPRAFVIDDPDLSAATVHVRAIEGDRILFTPRFAPFAEPGMTVVDERGLAIGKIKSIAEGAMTLSRDVITRDHFPDADEDGRRTVRIMVIGPGDRVILHDARRTAP